MVQPKEGQPEREVTWDEITHHICEIIKALPECATVWGIPTNGALIARMIAKQCSDVEVSVADEPEPWMIVIDDIHDSGKTALPYHNEGNRVMTLYSRAVEDKRDADFYVEQVIGDEWLVFPWEEEISSE